MRVEIVTIGNEVLSGRTLDTNFAFLSRALEQASVTVGWHATVGDSAEAIGGALRHALERADAVVMTGGLGPTPDDLTRKAVAAVLRRPLQLDEQVLEAIRARIKKFGRKIPASIETQALLPRLSVGQCLHYTLTLDPDVALLGLSFPNEQDQAFAAAHAFAPLTDAQMAEVRGRAIEARHDKGPCWWNPDPEL